MPPRVRIHALRARGSGSSSGASLPFRSLVSSSAGSSSTSSAGAPLAFPSSRAYPSSSVRAYASKSAGGDAPAQGSGPNMDQLPHVSEEKAAINKAMGREGAGPEAEDMGTPVAEVVKDDPKLKESLPKVMRDEIEAGKDVPKPHTDPAKNGGQKRGFATFARSGQHKGFSASRGFSTSSMSRSSRGFSASSMSRSSRFGQQRGITTSVKRNMAVNPDQGHEPTQSAPGDSIPADNSWLNARLLEVGQQRGPGFEELSTQLRNTNINNDSNGLETLPEGLKFPLPEEPLTRRDNMKHRYDEVIDQFTNLLMKDGRKARAQTFTAEALSYLRTSPPPQPKSKNSPLARFPVPATALPLNPAMYLTLALDALGPLIRIVQRKGAGGGGTSLPIPAPLHVRPRRRMAVTWILENVEKRKRNAVASFGRRLGEEIVAVVEGRSSAWEKRNAVHRQGVSTRANIGSTRKAKARKQV